MTPQNRQKSGRPMPPVEHRFKPGQSGNPGGRPKSKLLSEAYKKILETEIKSGKHKGKTFAEVIAQKMAEEATKGKVQPAAEMADRVEGKPRQAYEVKMSIMDELADRMEKARKRVKK